MRSMISTNNEIAYMILNSPLSVSTTDIIDEIFEKYSIRLNYSTVQRFRKSLPKVQRKELVESRKELLGITMFVISNLKESFEKIDGSDNKTRLELSKELRDCIKLYKELLNQEIQSLNNQEPF